MPDATPDKAPRPQGPDQWIDSYLNGELTADAGRAFEQWLLEDPAHVEKLARAVLQDTHLRSAIVGRSLESGFSMLDSASDESKDNDEQLMSIDRDIMNELVDQALARRRAHEIEDAANALLVADQADAARNRRFELRHLNAVPAPSKRAVVIPPALVWLSLAAAIGLAVWLGWPEQTVVDETGPVATQEPADVSFVATVSNSHNARWFGSLDADGHLREGERVTLAEGVAEVDFESGATLVVQGPASFTLQDATHLKLDSGRAVSRVPEGTPGFTIDLPTISLDNLGGEFGCVVSLDGPHRIDIFEGVVNARAQSIAGGEMRLVAGQAVQTNAGVVERVAPQRTGYVRGVTGLAYRDAVLAAGPLSYWPLQDDPSATAFTDLVDDGLPLFPRLAPVTQVPGPMAGTALWFGGQGILDLSADGGLASARYNHTDAFTVQAWVYPDAAMQTGYLVIVNWGESGRTGWGMGLKPAGQPGRFTPFLDVLDASWDFPEATIASGQWTHLTLTKDRLGVARLYLNGVEAGRHEQVPGPPEAKQFFHLVGRVNGERWLGGLAHVALYDRALSPGEVGVQTQLGTGQERPHGN